MIGSDESEPKLQLFVLTRFLYANRYPLRTGRDAVAGSFAFDLQHDFRGSAFAFAFRPPAETPGGLFCRAQAWGAQRT
jgi:hypothetical protein